VGIAQVIIAASIVVTALVAWALFHVFFNDMDDFWECCRSRRRRTIFSILEGDHDDEEEPEVTWWDQMKAYIYMFLSAGCGVCAYFGLHKVFGK
jgi:hypothetical protein